MRKLEAGSIINQKDRAIDNIRGIAHALHASSGNNGSIAKFDALSSKYNRFHATRTNFIDGCRIGSGREAGRKSDLTSGRLTDTCLNDISKEDFLYDRRVNLGLCNGVLECNCAQLRGGERL